MATKDWNGGNRAPEPDVAFGSGYDVDTTANQANESGVNAWLSDSADNTHVRLTILTVETDLRLAGSRGQSQLQQDFYPRNFEQTSWSITCQARSQKEIGRVAEFVHKAQRNAVSKGSLMGLLIPQGGLRGTASGMRGVRQGLNMVGYIKNVPRAHRRHDPAPTFQIEFVVSRMLAGPFQDQPYKVYKLASWTEIVDKLVKQNFIPPPKTADQEAQAEADRQAKQAIEVIRDVGDWFGDLLNK